MATPQEIELELGREEVRSRREERKGLGVYWRGYVVLLGLLVLIALVSTAVIVVGLLGDHVLVAPALGSLAGSGGAGYLLWRSYSERLRRK